MVGNQLGDKGPGGTVVLELFDDVGMGRPPFRLHHRLVGGALQQGVPEFKARLAIFVV